MITQTAMVMDVHDETASVQVIRESTCGQCSVQKGCGTSVFSRILGNKFSRLTVLNPVNAQQGDVVILGLQESVLIKSTLLMYLFPLLMMFGGAVLVVMLNNFLGFSLGQGWVIASSFLSLILAFVYINRVSRGHQNDRRYQPVILRKASLSELKASPFQISIS
jgi:sigma-E factor negative regulatory protein RseC